LRSGEGDCGPARHEALIAPELWEAVQMRREKEDKRQLMITHSGHRPSLLSGFLLCAGCGSPMRGHRKRATSLSRSGEYCCSMQERCQSDCREPRCSLALADAAVLREVLRLRAGRPWTPAAMEEIVQPDPLAAERAQLESQIAAARREMATNLRLLKLVSQDGDPDSETLNTFRHDQQQLDREIKSLQARLEELPHTPPPDPRAVAGLYAQLSDPLLADIVVTAQGEGDVVTLRELLAACVQTARISERVRAGVRNGRTAWVRAEVRWTAQVERLLETGYLALEPAPEAPRVPTPAERTAARMRSYRARRRQARDAVLQPTDAFPEGLLTPRQAAQALGLTVDGVRNGIKRGALAFVHLEGQGGRHYLTPQEVERYRQERLGKPGRKPRG
jgi:Recombinase zinc beta ribbon domain